MTVENGISDKEKEAINNLRQRFDGLLNSESFEDDLFFHRFLVARDFNVDNSETMLRKHLEWGKKYDVKNALKYKIPEVGEKYLPYFLVGHDKEGCVIRYIPVGNTDFSGIFASATSEDVAKTLIYFCEQDVAELKRQSEKHGRYIGKVIYIADFKNLSFSLVTDKRAVVNFMMMLNIYINNYPERLKAGFAINASFYFTVVYSLMKSILPATIMEKINVYSDDSYQAHLLKLIDEESLPTFLGGKNTDLDGHPMNKYITEKGERVPEKYYIGKNKQPLSKQPGVKKVTLSRAAFHEINLQVTEVGSYLEWEFETKCRDIGFGVFFQEKIDGEEKITEIVPITRIDTEEYPETGTYRCEMAGTYIIVFDNTYSWVRAKEIYYKAKIVSKKEQEAELKD